MKNRRKFRCLSAEKVLRKEIPPVATRRGRPVWSSGTLEMPVAGGRRSEVSKSDIEKGGKRKHRQAERGFKPAKFIWLAREQLSWENMRSIFCCALGIALIALPNAEARRVRHKPPTPF